MKKKLTCLFELRKVDVSLESIYVSFGFTLKSLQIRGFFSEQDVNENHESVAAVPHRKSNSLLFNILTVGQTEN